MTADLREGLEAVVGLLQSATEGPWRWSENGNILGHMPDGYDESREVCAVYTDDEATGAPNAPAICAAVNFLRQHGPALLALARDGERLDWLQTHGYSYGFEDMIEGTHWEIRGAWLNLREAIDAEIAAEAIAALSQPGTGA